MKKLHIFMKSLDFFMFQCKLLAVYTIILWVYGAIILDRNDFFLLRQMIRRNVQSRFRGSFFGWLWNLLLPLLMLTVYTIVFGGFFKARWGVDIGENKMVFAIALFSGITLYNIFSESVAVSSYCITGNINYVKKVRFKLELLPLSQTLSTFVLSLTWLLLLLVFVAWIFSTACWSWLLLPMTLIPLVLFTAGISFLTASLGVYFRDLQYLINILLQMLFFLSPVFYRLGSLPKDYQQLLRLNPLVWFIELNRGVLFYRLLPEYSKLPAASDYLICYLLGGVLFALGWGWFHLTKRGFSDVL